MSKPDGPGGATAHIVLLAALLVAGFPLAVVVWQVAGWWGRPLGPGTALLAEMVGRTVVIALAISLLATVVALPAAWALRGGSRLGTALVAVPLMMPSYLAYAAYSTLREGDHWLGRTLGQLPGDANALLGQALAVLGLVMWVWPLPALVMATGFSGVGQATLDALALDGTGFWRRWRVVLGMCRTSVLQALLITSLLMVGSAVPLHLAQIQTYAIYVWKLLDLMTDPGVAWRVALPLVVLAVIAAELIARRVSRPRAMGDTDPAEHVPPAKTSILAAATVWLISIPLPLALFAFALHDRSLLTRFWREDGPAAAQSAMVALVVGVCAACMGLLTWCALATTHRPARFRTIPLNLATRLLLITALIPGVLVGAATATGWSAVNWPRSSLSFLPSSLLVLAHLARFGFLGVLAGWLFWRLEPAALRDLRAVEGGPPVRAWWLAAALPRSGAVAGVGLACAALSFHEIESSVILQPPGTQSMARRLLEYLHYLKDQQVAAAAVNLMIAAVAVALLAGWLIAGGTRIEWRRLNVFGSS